MINGYARAGCYVNALEIFRGMQVVGIEPDEISVISVLPTCAQLGALEVAQMEDNVCQFGLCREICGRKHFSLELRFVPLICFFFKIYLRVPCIFCL
uniref:Pentatricopeptide repeat-containing protein At2g20540 family n=1 Tax=Cajanus cajan TaxID=3821 RepID=A0A151R668_CAJCA|nr:Pentatricopeptide repeat-containing protein At2g20540 family [Cajanus cajan]